MYITIQLAAIYVKFLVGYSGIEYGIKYGIKY